MEITKNKKSEHFGNFHPDKIKMIGILIIGRSSSIFFQGLLDGHPSIITMPGSFYSTSINLENNSAKIAKEYYSALVAFFREREVFFDEKKFSFKKFEKPFLDFLSYFKVSRKNVFIATHYAFSIILGKDENKIKYISYYPHSNVWLTDCFKDFPNMKLFITVRDPRATFASTKIKGHLLSSFMGDIEAFFLYRKMMKKIGRQNIHVVKHELLHTEYPKVMDQFCSFLSIKKTDSLLYSSFFDVPFYCWKAGKSVTGIISSKPNPSYVTQNWKKQLSSFEISFIQHYQSKMMKEFNYEYYDAFKEPKFRFCGTIFLPLTIKKIENSGKLKKFILKFLVSLARIPILGYLMILFIQISFYTLKYCKHLMNIISLTRKINVSN